MLHMMSVYMCLVGLPSAYFKDGLILYVCSPVMWLRLSYYQQEDCKFFRSCLPLLWEQLTYLCLRYCNQYVDQDALLYLILVNDILHDLHPNVVTIAEDVSNWLYSLKH